MKEKKKYILKAEHWVTLSAGIFISAISIIVLSLLLYQYAPYMNLLPPSQTDGSNINVMLERGEDWYKVDDVEPIITERQFAHRFIDGSTATVPITAEIGRQYFNYTDEEIRDLHPLNSFHTTTPIAISSLIRDNDWDNPPKRQRLEIIFTTHPSVEELAGAAAQNVVLDIAPVALDAFVFIVNKGNPIDTLSVEQIRSIYSGEITNWRDVGGTDSIIMPFQREKNSGSQTAMEELVMKGEPLIDPISTFQISTELYSMGSLVERVAAEYNNTYASIGYTYQYYINNLYKNDNIKVLKIDGVEANVETVQNNEYPFYTAYYGIVRENDGPNGKGLALREFMRSEKGQEFVALAGYYTI